MSALTILFIRAYQFLLSPFLGTACRFTPTCSHYGIEAIRTHGMLRGSALTLKRLLRCQPLSESRFDPVPPLHTK